MITLLLDSSSARLCIALAKDKQVFARIDEEAFQTQSEIMTDRIAALIQEHSLAFTDLSAIVVANGPGSFTGVRIAVSISKVMAYALRIPLYAVSSLSVFKDEIRKTICVLDARKERSFAAIYEGNKQISPAQIMTNDEIILRAKNEGLLIGGETKHLGIDSIVFDRFSNMLSLKNEESRVSDVSAFKPVYLKG